MHVLAKLIVPEEVYARLSCCVRSYVRSYGLT